MPGPAHFLLCLSKAVVKNAGKALWRLLPFGEVVFDVARDAYEDYRRDHTEADLRADLEMLAQANQPDVRHAAEAVASRVAADQPAEVRLALTSYLNQLPASIRQSLRRPSDLGGTTVPPGLSLRKTEDLLPFLPVDLPRFKPGDRPLAADWELVELLGKGGFGEVWKARHLTRSRQKAVALKFCLDPVAAATLRNEAALHDHLDRVREEAAAPGIVPLLETYLRADPPCLMYEFIEGGDLTGLVHEMQAQDQLTPAFATKIIHRLASIVAVAHRLVPPLVHRDLKMSNVLVRPGSGVLPDLFVADFGIGGLAAGQALREQAGRRPLSSQLLPTAIRGAYTPLYASPQQVQGERPDPRDDVHAMGVIWYQLVTGDLRLLSIPPDWRDVVEERGLGEEQVCLLAACIASRAEKRPFDAADLAERLDRCLVPTADTSNNFKEQVLSLKKRLGKRRQHLQAFLAKLQAGEILHDAAQNASPVVDGGLQHLLGEGNETGYLTHSQVSNYLSASVFRIEPDGPVKVIPDDAANQEKLEQLLIVLEEQGIELIDETEAIPLDPNNALFYYKRGMAWRKKEEYDNAIKDYDEAINLDPNYVDAYEWRGLTWEAKGDNDKAIQDLDEALRLRPNAFLYFYVSRIRLAKGDYDTAIKDLDEAIRLDPTETYFHTRGMACFCMQDYDKAIKDFNEAICLDPKNADAFCHRGRTWHEKQEYDKAILDYDEAIRLDPTCKPACTGRALAWSRKKNHP